LKKYLGEGEIKEEPLFNFPYQIWGSLWKTETKAAGIRITPQVLRVWFSIEMGEQAYLIVLSISFKEGHRGQFSQSTILRKVLKCLSGYMKELIWIS